MKEEVHIPRYQQIALNIAGQIISGEYREGDRIFARSTIASKYGVSPETARRAVALLTDLGIISTLKGSGCTIESMEKAIRFRSQFQDIDEIHILREELKEQIQMQCSGLKQLRKNLDVLAEHMEHYQYADPLYPMCIRITEKCRFLRQSIKDLQLWQHTSATIVALKHDGAVTISPGPYAELNVGDDLYFVGTADCWLRLHRFLYVTDDREPLSEVIQGKGSVKNV